VVTGPPDLERQAAEDVVDEVDEHPCNAARTSTTAKATPELHPSVSADFLKARKILIRLGAKLDLLDPFPEKPPRMHWRTYERLYHIYGIAKDRNQLASKNGVLCLKSALRLE
jgi:hypothetical protein